MAQDKTIGLVLIEAYADCEFGLLSASVGEWFSGRGTLALARAGLSANAAHTSDDRDWIAKLVPHYRDAAHAVADGKIVSAPGLAPSTFATEFLRVLHPDQAGKAAEMKAIFAKEYA